MRVGTSGGMQKDIDEVRSPTESMSKSNCKLVFELCSE